MPGLGTTLGRGGATTALQDLENADVILIQGSSMAEAHPVGFRFVMQAKARGATIVHIDPRFSRTSALADLWIPIRAGGDLALLGGLIRHVLATESYFREYVAAYTNASFVLTEDFADTEQGDGLFSGFDADTARYDPTSWRYETDADGRPVRDETLAHPRCVLNVLARHFARYTPDAVERVAGVPPEKFARLADLLTDASGPEKTAAICYAVGWTQHSKGVQIIRAAAILQLLLGNVGRPGGGILALRGHASIQGSTDIPTLYDILPGYLPMPRHDPAAPGFDAWVAKHHKDAGWWSNFRKYAVSLMRAFYGARAGPETDHGFDFFPRLTGNHSHFAFFADMADGKVEGLFVMGQNPAVGGQHARLERHALSRLKWLVVRDLVEIETAAFWSDSSEVRSEDVQTELFLFPAAGHAEKEGSFTQTQRMLQWREKAVDPPGDARSEAWFVHQLAKRLIAKARESDAPEDEALRALDWWYPETPDGEPEMEAVLEEINGYRTAPQAPGGHHGARISGFTDLADDGSTACGCWIYSGVYGPNGVNRARGREATGRYGHGWGFAWPSDRRILYNRASARPDGRPWSEKKALVWWDPDAARWTGHDVPDFPATKPPDYVPAPGATGIDAHPGTAPYLMNEEGVGRLFVPEGLADGPLPTHYEPLESPVANALHGQDKNPVAGWFPRPDNPFVAPGDPDFPVVLTTYRLTEHHTAGGMSRFLPHLAELMPELFVELSPELADDLHVANGDTVRVTTPRGSVRARALVTRRIRPIRLGDRTVHQVAMPFHWGSAGPVRGDVVNDLIPLSAEPNVTIHESKALLCRVERTDE